jgi:tRNA (guanine37-N1)-methyltransferase
MRSGVSIKNKERAKTYEEMLSGEIAQADLKNLSKGYDQLGNIAIIDFDGKKSTEKRIANILMKFNKSVTTVLAKAGAVTGKYRIRKVRYIAGSKTYIAEYKENGCTFRFDVRKVFFSNRLSFERSRILKLIKKNEKVLVMFSGVGPFAIEIGKHFKDSKVVGIELNKYGYKCMLDNVKLNKLSNVTPVLGDVKKLVSKYGNFADRIIMPLPKSSLEFLDDAYYAAKRKATIHLYTFTSDEKPFDAVYKKVLEHSKAKNYKTTLIDKRIVRPYSKSEVEVVLDYRIEKQ